MAVSGKVYAKGDFSVGIIQKNATAFETAAAADAAYKLLPVINVSSPVLNLVESGEIRSNNAGMIETDKEQFRSRKGGFVTILGTLLLSKRKSTPDSPYPLSTKSVLITLCPFISIIFDIAPSPQAHSHIVPINFCFLSKASVAILGVG